MGPALTVEPPTVAAFRGSPAERGRAHGELLGEAIRSSGILPFYRGFCERHLPPSARDLARPGLAFLHALVARRLSAPARAAVGAMAAGAGLRAHEAASGLVMPDVLNYLAGTGARLSGWPGLGCTSLAVWGDYSLDGKMYVGRNLDFPGNGVYEQVPLVARHTPDRGLPYVSLTVAGCPVDGVTGINAEGLTVALHQHPTADAGIFFDGRPVLDLGWTILQHARTLEDAAEIAGRWPTTSGWTVVLTHAASRRAWALERTRKHLSVQRYIEGRMVRTNDFADPQLSSGETDYAAFRANSALRMTRARALVEARKGRLDAGGLAAILADHVEPERGAVRAFGQTISQPNNMTSVVFVPEDGELWMGVGPVPVCDGTFRKLRLWDDSGWGEELDRGPDPFPAAKREALTAYLEGYALMQQGGDSDRVSESISRAVRLDGQEPIYHLMSGLFHLKAGRIEDAREALAAGAALPDLEHRRRVQRLWQARAEDLSGRRAEAEALYKSVAEEGASAALVRAAAAGAARAYRKDALPGIMPDMTFGDTFKY